MEHYFKILLLLWTLFSLLNSVYSLIWDICIDWQLFLPLRGSSQKSRFSSWLNRPLYFHSPFIYYLAVLFNTFIRLLWIVKLGLLYQLIQTLFHPARASSYPPLNNLQHSLLLFDFSLKVLEIVRRWVWVFFRIERESMSRSISNLDVSMREQQGAEHLVLYENLNKSTV
jgi:hypothetical protein